MGTIVAIPEPTTIALFGLGLGAAGYGWWRRRSFRNEEEAVSEILGE
jgi:hypothetical protein